MAHKARVKGGCGCSTKSGKLYILKTPGRLKATKCKGQAVKAYKTCRKTHKQLGVCTMTVVRGARKPRRHRRR
jgi:hypothetical protein